MRRSARWSMGLAIAVILTVSATAPVLFRSITASAFPAVDTLALDCDVATDGVQSACTFAAGTTAFDVAVVYQRALAGATEVNAFNFEVAAPQLAFAPAAGADGNLNANPDFAELTPGTWACVPPSPSADNDPATDRALSFLSCYSADTGPVVASGGELRVATIHYTVPNGDAAGELTLHEVAVGNSNGDAVVECYSPAVCPSATIAIGAAQLPTATSIPTETLTPTVTATATSLPDNGGVSSMLGFNSSVCVTGAIFFARLSPISAIKFCNNIDEQNATDEGAQSFLRCLRGTDYDNDGDIDCSQGFDPDAPLYVPGILQATPEDFTKIDRDADQTRYGIRMLVLAFVSGDAPVTFETDQGVLLGTNGTVEGTSYVCDDYIPGVSGDPDCDANVATEGDRLVAAYVFISDQAYRGPVNVIATQNGVPQTFTFQVTGPATSIDVSYVGGKYTIEKGATSCAGITAESTLGALPFDADEAARNGSAATTEAVAFVRVLDDTGVPVTGALTSWEHPYFEGGSGVPSALAGVLLPQISTFDFGEDGIGIPELICSKSQSGVFQSAGRIDSTLDPYANATAGGLIEITVLDNLLTPTPSPTSTATVDGTATYTPTFTPTIDGTATYTPTITPTVDGTATYTPTFTPTATSTFIPLPSATNSPTNTPTAVPTATDTPTPSSTAAPPSSTPTNTSTPPPTTTSTATTTPTPASSATSTSTPTATATSAPVPCATLGQRISLLIGIVRRMGAERGDRGARGYKAKYDIDHDGDIDLDDALRILRAPICRGNAR